MELYDNIVLNRRRRAEWEMDFSSTYLLHAFSTSRYLDFINPKTILSRTSNFGVATYDVVKKMRADGLISGNEDGKSLSPEEAGELMHKLEPGIVPLPPPGDDVVESTELKEVSS